MKTDKLKTYTEVPLKRFVQKELFNQLPDKFSIFTGLAGPNYLIYRKTILFNCNPRKIILVDKNSTNNIVKKDNIENYLSNVMDLDFCSSIISDGEKFNHIFLKMNKLNNDKYLFFTFSLRLAGGLERTLSFLKQYANFRVINKRIIKSGKYGDSYCLELITNNENVKLYSYKDTNCMLSGLIKF